MVEGANTVALLWAWRPTLLGVHAVPDSGVLSFLRHLRLALQQPIVCSMPAWHTDSVAMFSNRTPVVLLHRYQSPRSFRQTGQ